MSSSRFAKRDRERVKRERAELKKEKKEIRRSDAAEAGTPEAGRAQEDVLAALAALHEAHEAGRVTFDDFEEAKAELLAQLQV